MKLIDLGGNIYRLCEVKYLGLKIEGLIAEDDYRKKLAEKKAKKVSKLLDGRGSRSDLNKRAWTIFSKWIRVRDDYICCCCGAVGKQSSLMLPENEGKLSDHIHQYPYAKIGAVIQGGHYYPKSVYKGIAYDERNVNAQCAKCNMSMEDKDVEDKYTEYMINTYGANVVERLHDFGKRGGYSRQDLELIAHKYKI